MAPGRRHDEFAHTALGQTRTARHAGLDQTTTYAYDVLGRLASRTDPDGNAYWTYDPTNGKGELHRRCRGSTTLASCAGAPDFVETLAYGGDARPSSATTAICADGQPRRSYVHEFGYDRSGRLSTVGRPSGVTTLREYNGRGHLAAVKDNATRAVLERYAATDAFGSVASVEHGNGFATARTFDADTDRQTGAETTRGRSRPRSGAPRPPSPCRRRWRWRRPPRRSGGRPRRTSGGGARRPCWRTATCAAAAPCSPRPSSRGRTAPRSWRSPNRCGSAGCPAGRSRTPASERSPPPQPSSAGPARRAPASRRASPRGPNGGLHFRRSAWREDGAERVERRYAVGAFEEPASAASASSTYSAKHRHDSLTPSQPPATLNFKGLLTSSIGGTIRSRHRRWRSVKSAEL